MGRRVDPPAIVRLLEELQPLVRTRGFASVSGKSEWTGKFNIVTWVRTTWKEDALRVGWRPGPVPRYFLDAQWSVPQADGRPLIASGLNASYARRRRNPGLPTQIPLIRQIAEQKWCAEALADAEFALAWCDRSSTLDGALADLARPDRNGPPAGTAAYAYIEQYIRAHAMIGLPSGVKQERSV